MFLRLIVINPLTMSLRFQVKQCINTRVLDIDKVCLVNPYYTVTFSTANKSVVSVFLTVS